MNFANYPVQTQAPHFMDLGLLDINKFNESSVLSTPSTSIWRPKHVSHWSAPDHIFGEATAVRMIVAKSDRDYSYKPNFEIWKENQEFERQIILMSQPPL